MRRNRTAGASVVKLTYGYTVKDKSDEYITVAERAAESFSVATTPGMFMVDVLPSRMFNFVSNHRGLSRLTCLRLVKYIPWMPFVRTVKLWRRYLRELIEMPMEFVHNQMVVYAHLLNLRNSPKILTMRCLTENWSSRTFVCYEMA